MPKGMGLLISIAVFLVAACSTVSAAEVIKLKVAEFNPTNHPTSLITQRFCEEVNKRAAGRLELNFYPGGILLSGAKMFTGVNTGIADIGFSHIGYTRGRFPVTEVFELPLGFPSGYVAGHVCNDFFNKFSPAEWNSVHVFHFYASPPAIIETTTKPVRTLEDLRGLKIRATGRAADLVKALGGTPVPLEISDVYEGLRRNVVNGTMLDFSPLKYFKLWDVMKYATASWQVGTQFTFYCVMNHNKWNNLPPDLKKILSDAAAGLRDKQVALWDQISIETRDTFKSQGGQIVYLSDAEAGKWKKAVEPVIASYKKDMMSKGVKGPEIDGWISYVQERIEYWKKEEKGRGLPSVF